VNFDTLFVNAAGRTSRGPFVGALITLLAVFAFYYFLVPGRDSQWCQLVLLFPAVVLHARRLHDMGRTAWPVLVPAALVVATVWLVLYIPRAQARGAVTVAALIVCAGFVVWGLVGRGQAEANRFGNPAA
jgi:uncharacterized membrane protein YhaH (DUF805 family)